jgi:hypothetical protein
MCKLLTLFLLIFIRRPLRFVYFSFAVCLLAEEMQGGVREFRDANEDTKTSRITTSPDVGQSSLEKLDS